MVNKADAMGRVGALLSDVLLQADKLDEHLVLLLVEKATVHGTSPLMATPLADHSPLEDFHNDAACCGLPIAQPSSETASP